MKKQIFSIAINTLLVWILFTPHGSIQAIKTAKYIILFVADGCGENHFQAANSYTGVKPDYQYWSKYWVSTYPYGGSYQSENAWSMFDYIKSSATDSAAAATAMYTGEKTLPGHITVAAEENKRLISIVEISRDLSMSTGTVTSVFISHATPGAWFSHNDSRTNGLAIADEALWGNPYTTGSQIDPNHSGGHGDTLPAADVLIGAGHPDWNGNIYVSRSIQEKLSTENAQPGLFTYVERLDNHPNGGERLLDAASTPTVTRLAGLFGGYDGNLDYRYADGSGYNPENPTLAEMTQSALQVLDRDPDGFILLIEAGAIDWASHANHMDKMIGEVIDFNLAVDVVIDWVSDPSNDSNWENTLVIITADHETGYLTKAPGIFPNTPLGEINSNTLNQEKKTVDQNIQASWDDKNNNLKIDDGEEVYWAWNSTNHTNSLVPLYSKGYGEHEFNKYAIFSDPERGLYLDNTNIFHVMLASINGNAIIGNNVYYLPAVSNK